MVHCVIEYEDNPSGIFNVGTQLNGIATLILHKSEKVASITLEIRGVAYCKWTSVTNGIRTFCCGEEDYLNSINYIIGRKEGPELDVRSGTYSYNFSCHLPENLPTSFEHSIGHIRYAVTVKLDRPKKTDLCFELAFTVLRPLNLELEVPECRLPCQQEEIKRFGCCCCLSDPLKIVVQIPQTGYVPGQAIDIQADFLNQSDVVVYEIKFTLRKIVRFHSNNLRTKEHNKDISDVVKKRILGMPGQARQRFTQKIIVPLLPPTLFKLSKIIDISYELVVQSKMSDANVSPTVTIPVIIGTIPLNSSLPDESPEPELLDTSYLIDSYV